MLHSMGLCHDLEKKGAKVREYCFWSSDDDGSLRRTNIGPDVINETPFPWTLSVEEAELRDILAEDLRRYDRKVEHSMEFLMYPHPTAHQPLVALIKNHTSNVIETWYVQYILGCDGAKSRVRETAGVSVDSFGELGFWGMAHFSVNSDCPDIRRRCTVRSRKGNCTLTPGINGSVRMMTRISREDFNNNWNKLTNSTNGETPHPRDIDEHVLMLQTKVKNTLLPYTCDITKIHWLETFATRKNLAKSFSSETSHVFLLGGASRVHSPITKQMINGGLLDALNLTWKLALVLDGSAPRSLLATYEAERRTTLPRALELDDAFDRIFAMPQGNTSLAAGFHSFEEASGYTSGCGVRYPQSQIVREEVRALIKKVPDALTPGKRLLPITLIRHLDGNEVNILEALPPDCRFTILVFAGEILHAAVLRGMARYLASKDSPLVCFNPVTDPRRSRVKLALVHTIPHFDISIPDLPQPFPQYPDLIFEDLGGKAHASLGISPKLSAICCLRPDGYIGVVTNPDDCAGVKEYLRASLTGPIINLEEEIMEFG